MHLLLIEDEMKIADFVCAGLKEQGMHVEHCGRGDEGFERARDGNYDAIILDIMLPGRDGLSVLKGLRKVGNNTPVILLTARNELEDRTEGLNLGADDYLAKPFFVEELAARLNAVTRRISGERQNYIEAEGLRLDRISRQVTHGDETLELTSKEFNLLEYLMRSPGRAFTRTQILEHVWGYDFSPNTNVVDVCIKRIRNKIGHTSALDSPIEAIRGVGYRFRKSQSG